VVGNGFDQGRLRFGVLAGLFYSKLRAAIDLEKII
jgi:hypothetical protein